MISSLLSADSLPIQYHYPVLNHAPAGGDIHVFTGGKEEGITPMFLNPEDECTYDYLNWAIKLAPIETMNEVGVFSAPAVYFIGHFAEGSDKMGGRRLIISSWYIVNPFLEMDSPAAGYPFVQYGLSLKSFIDGAPSEFTITEKNLLLSLKKHQREVEHRPHKDITDLKEFISLFPVLSMDIKTSRVKILIGTWGPHKICETKVFFLNEKERATFFNEKNQLFLKESATKDIPPMLFLVGKLDFQHKILTATSWRDKPLNEK